MNTSGVSLPAGQSAALTAKILPPAPPPSIITRPALEHRLAEALGRRLTSVVAGAGFGKSTLLSGWASGVHCAWYTLTADDADLASLLRGIVQSLRLRLPSFPPEITAAVDGIRGPGADTDEVARAQAWGGLLCDALQQRLRRDLVLVLDDVHEVDLASPSARLIEALSRQAPSRLHLVLASRREPPFPIERLRGQGQVLEIAGSELAFTLDEVAALLEDSLEEGAGELAGGLLEATGGWPAAVRLAVEALRAVPAGERRQTLDRVKRPEGPLFAYLAAEVFEREPIEVRELIRTVAPLEGFTADLCDALGVERAAEVLASLAKRGLFLELGRSETGWFTLGTLVREFALERYPLEPTEVRDVHRRAAAWFETQGYVEEALRSLAATGDHGEITRLLKKRGRSMLRAGAVESVIRATELVPPDRRDAGIDELEGAAHQIRGDWEGALACFKRIAADAGPLPAGIAWRLGLIHHFRGRLDEALEIYERGQPDSDGAARDEALLLAWKATAYWLRGDRDACRENAARAFTTATEAGDSQALAAAHTVLAMLAALEGDRGANDAHYLRALEHAQRAADGLQIIRIHTNRASRHVEEGSYEDALAELETAIQLADVAGFAIFQALGLSNRGEAEFHLARLEEAIVDLEASKAIYQRIGSRMISYPLQKLGDVYRERGDAALAQAAYEEAIEQAEAANDLQGLVPALAGLARVLAADEPEEATALAERAVACGPGMFYVSALLAAGWVALAQGDRDAAADKAADAAAAARARRDRAGLAEALQLQALSAPDPGLEAPRLEQAISIFREIHDPLGEARSELSLARISGEAGRARAERAERRLQKLGARGHAASAAAFLAGLDRQSRAPVAIEALGRFRVLRERTPVPLADWQSKKARDLLKILVARRGRPTPRDYVREALWPEEDPAKTGNRLSVALSTVRAVLDPEKRFDPEHFVTADKSALALELANLSVDVESFLADASAGLALHRQGRIEESSERLLAAETAYAGDFLEEDAYEDWAVALREEARASYVGVARTLAEDAASAGDHDAAGRYLLRILERDTYDEQAHLALVSALLASGRHGEARRCYRNYCARMEEIGVEAAPLPSLTRARVGAAPAVTFIPP